MPPCLRIALDVTYRNLVPLVNAKAQPLAIVFLCSKLCSCSKSVGKRERPGKNVYLKEQVFKDIMQIIIY